MSSSGPGRSNYDQAFKRLLGKHQNEFLQFLLPELRLPAGVYTWIAEAPTELPAAPLQADRVWIIEDVQRERILLHIEVQTRPDQTMGKRVMQYGTRLILRDDMPPLSVVIYLEPSANIETSPYIVVAGGIEVLRYNYVVVPLWTISAARILNTEAYDLWPLAVLMKDVTLESAIKVAQDIAQLDLSRAERGELIGLEEALSVLRLGRGALHQALRRYAMDELLVESSIYQEALAKGKAEGLVEGQQRAARDMALAVLEKRFLTVSADLIAAIEAADEATLRALAGDFATESLEQIRARLGLN